LREAEQAFGLDDVSGLAPGGLHEDFLVLLYDARADAGAHAPGNAAVETVQPVVALGWHHLVRGSMPGAVDRRPDDRHVLRLALRCDDALGHGLAGIEDGRQVLGDGCYLAGVGRIVVADVQRKQRAFVLAEVVAVQVGFAQGAGVVRLQDMVGIHFGRQAAEAGQFAGDIRVVGIVLGRLQPAGQRLEVAGRAGAEVPVEIGGQFQIGARAGSFPGRLEQGVGGQWAAQTAVAAGLEDGNKAGEIAGVGRQPLRADEAREVARRGTLEHVHRVLRRVVTHHLGVRPHPGLGERRERRFRRQDDRRQQASGAHLRLADLGSIENDQRQPGHQAVVGIRRGRGEHPGKIGRIELDGRQVIGFEIVIVRAWFGAHDDARIDADDVAGPGNFERQFRRCRLIGAGPLADELHADLHHRQRGGSGQVELRLLVGTSQTTAGPGEEIVVESGHC